MSAYVSHEVEAEALRVGARAVLLLTVNGRGCILAVGVDVTDRTGFADESTL